MKTTITSSVLILLITLLITPGTALYCSMCADDVGCEKLRECPVATPQLMEETRTSFFPDSKVDYSKVENLPKPVCYTSVVSEGGKKRTIRDCSAVGSELTCRVLRGFSTSQTHELDFCLTCGKDLCNTNSTVKDTRNDAPQSLQASTVIVLTTGLLLRYLQ